MKKQNIELLAPAGSFEAYKAAVNAGADAVYLGGKAFNARHQANNFDNQTLKEVITDARIRGVKTYIVLNTLVSDKELRKPPNWLLLFIMRALMALLFKILG